MKNVPVNVRSPLVRSITVFLQAGKGFFIIVIKEAVWKAPLDTVCSALGARRAGLGRDTTEASHVMHVRRYFEYIHTYICRWLQRTA